jgi:hypothetical protein
MKEASVAWIIWWVRDRYAMAFSTEQLRSDYLKHQTMLREGMGFTCKEFRDYLLSDATVDHYVAKPKFRKE